MPNFGLGNMQNFANMQGGQQKSQTDNRAFASYPKEAYENDAFVQSSQPSGENNLMPILMQLMGGGNKGGIENLLKGGQFDMTALLRQNSSAKSTKKEGVAPKDDLVL